MPLLFERQSAPTQIFGIGTSAMRSIELSDGRLLVMVYDAQVPGVRGRFFDAAGADAGTPFTLANHAPASDLAALPNGGFVLAYVPINGNTSLFEFHDATGAQVGPTIQANAVSSAIEPVATVLSSGHVVVAWTDQNTSGPDKDGAVSARIFDANGTPLSGQFLVNTTLAGREHTPQIVALNNGGFVVDWLSPSGGAFQIYDGNGAKVGAEVTTPGSSLALLSNGNFVTGGYGGANIYDPTGALVASIPIGLIDGTAYPLLVLGTADGGFVTQLNNFNIVYDNQGVQQGTSFDISLRDNPAQVLALRGGGFAYAGYLQNSAELQIIKTDDGNVDIALSQSSLSEMTVLNNYVASLSVTLGTLNGGYSYSIVSDSIDGHAFRIEGDSLFLNEAGVLDYETMPTISVTVRATDLNGLSTYETIQLNVADESVERAITGSTALPTLGEDLNAIGGGQLVSLLTAGSQATSVTGQIFDSNMHLIRSFAVSDDPNLLFQSHFNSVALASGGFVVTWDSPRGDNHATWGVLARVFDADGDPVSGVFLANTPGGFGALDPSVVALPSGQFVIAWEDRSTTDVRAQLFSSAGAEIGPEFAINSTVDGRQYQVALQPLGSGGFLATWTSQEDGSNEVRGRVFDSTGSAAADFLVNTTTAGDQSDAAATMLASGEVLVTWLSASHALLGQLFDSNGTKVGGELALQTLVGNAGNAPLVTALPEGGFALAWTDNAAAPDASGDSVWAQLFNHDGAAASARFLVNTDVAGNQALTDLDVLPNGELYVAWSSSGVEHSRDFDLTGTRTDWPVDDVLVGTPGADTLRGGTGDDIYFVDNPGDVVVEQPGEGSDTVYASISYVMTGSYSVETLAAVDSEASDPINLTGNSLANVVIGNAGDNVLNGGGGADVLEGLGGDDTYIVGNAAVTVVEGDGQGNDAVYSAVSFILDAGSEVETLSTLDWNATTAINLTGNEIANYLIGNAGANVLDGGGGGDVMDGRGGNDIYIVDDATDAVFESAGGGADAVYTSVSYTLQAGAEVETLSTLDWSASAAINLIGNEFANWLIGNAGANVLAGGGGNDIIDAKDGDDLLDGGSGADLMLGGAGNDVYIVDNAADSVVETAGEGNDGVYTTISYALAPGSEVETLSTLDWNGTGAINLTGNELGNYLIGNAGANLLNGGGGADIMVGKGGNDIYIVDNLGDIVYENAGEGADAIYTSVSYALNDTLEVENLSTLDWDATTAINLTGNALGNYMIGNGGANLLDGKGGNDILVGQGGADTFAFTSALGPGNVDHIGDMVSGTDHIALDHGVFAGVGLGALNANAFVVGTQAGDADDRIIYNSATGELFFDADGNGAGAAVLFAIVDGHPALTASDFNVI